MRLSARPVPESALRSARGPLLAIGLALTLVAPLLAQTTAPAPVAPRAPAGVSGVGPADPAGRWIAVGGTDRANVYLDLATLERRARLRSAWLLHDLRQADADGDRSWRVRVEYDCAHAIYRTLQVLFHAEAMGRGRPRARSAEPSPWRSAEPDSLNGQVMRRLCDAPAR